MFVIWKCSDKVLYTAYEKEKTLFQRWYLIFKYIMLKADIKVHTTSHIQSLKI